MNKKSKVKYSDVRRWVTQELCPGKNGKLYLLSRKRSLKKSKYINDLELFTSRYRYTISVNEERNYLGCTMTCRTPLAGENWNRGNDLPDGKLNRETWERIKDAIVRNELVVLSDYTRKPDKVIRHITVEEPRPSPVQAETRPTL